jgi:phosphate transport system protein
MLHELLKIFKPGNPLNRMGKDFATMLELTCDMILKSGQIFFQRSHEPEERSQLYRSDVKVNQLERSIRKQVVAQLGISCDTMPYCLALMSLVKDVERLGDYAKNLSEIEDICTDTLPDDDLVRELLEIRSGVEEALMATNQVFKDSDRERALALVCQGKDLAQRSESLVRRIAKSDHNASTTTALVLGSRYYKRIGGHLLNVLSSVVMPLHKIDYYDEDEIPSPK